MSAAKNRSLQENGRNVRLWPETQSKAKGMAWLLEMTMADLIHDALEFYQQQKGIKLPERGR